MSNHSDEPEFQVSAALNGLMRKTLVGSLPYIAAEAEHLVVDAIACDLHNNGYALQGNTEQGDHEWFAAEIYGHQHKGADVSLDRLSEKDRLFWKDVAQACVEAMPRLMSRIAHRCILHSRAMASLERAIRLEKKKAARRAGFENSGMSAPSSR